MHATHRIVDGIPLVAIWNDDGPLAATHLRSLTREELVALMQPSPVHFVIADVGRQLCWIPLLDCYVEWKREVRAHIVDDPSRPFDVGRFPEGYAYVASEWRLEDPAAPSIVLLERHH